MASRVSDRGPAIGGFEEADVIGQERRLAAADPLAKGRRGSSIPVRAMYSR